MSDGSPSVQDAFLGQLLSGRFLPKKILERNADVVVYEGVDRQTERPVRIQCPAKCGRLTAEQLTKVKACGPVMAKMAAVPGVVAAMAAGMHAGVPYLVVPALPGVTLAERLRHGRAAGQGQASVRLLRPWLDKVASTLDAMHAIGISHGRLGPDMIAVAADGSVSIDGFPIGLLLGALGDSVGAAGAGESAKAHRAPEVSGARGATPRSDQYALAAIVADVAGRKFPAVEQALAQRPEQRFPACSEFVAALRDELAAPAGAPVGTTDAPLEMDDLEAPGVEVAQTGRVPEASDEFGLELADDESASQSKKSRPSFSDSEEEDFTNVTFTKSGQSLLAPKGTLDKATDVSAAKSKWRRMNADFKSLSGNKQWIVRVVVVVVAACIALWILGAVWRGVTFAVRKGREKVSSVVGNLKPDMGKIRTSGEQLTDQMKKLWDEHVSDDDGEVPLATVVAGQKAEIEGNAWPSGRPQDSLAEETLQEPTGMIDELASHKDEFVQDSGLGVFHVEDPDNPDQPSWLGGFGLLRKRTGDPKPLLHGTLVHHADDETTFVIRYKQGSIQDFWFMRGSSEDKLIGYASLALKDKTLVADGGAFVLDGPEAECLAIAFEAGDKLGGQWCDKKKDKDKGTVFEPPTTIVPIDELETDDGLIAKYSEFLSEAVAKLPEIQKQANVELKKFVRAKKLK